MLEFTGERHCEFYSSAQHVLFNFLKSLMRRKVSGHTDADFRRKKITKIFFNVKTVCNPNNVNASLANRKKNIKKKTILILDDLLWDFFQIFVWWDLFCSLS